MRSRHPAFAHGAFDSTISAGSAPRRFDADRCTLRTTSTHSNSRCHAHRRKSQVLTERPPGSAPSAAQPHTSAPTRETLVLENLS
jgi:hypothetical protein